MSHTLSLGGGIFPCLLIQPDCTRSPMARGLERDAVTAPRPSLDASPLEIPSSCRERGNSDILPVGILRRGRLMAPPYARAALLDRDGTVIADRGYLADPGEWKFCRGRRGAGADAFFGARTGDIDEPVRHWPGYFDETQLRAVHHRMEELLEAQGVRLDGIYCCPCRPDQQCSCRKPEPGLVHAARAELGFDPSRSFVIGDKGSDIGWDGPFPRGPFSCDQARPSMRKSLGEHRTTSWMTFSMRRRSSRTFCARSSHHE